MAEDSKHLYRRSRLVEQYKQDERKFTKTLESISGVAFSILHKSPKLPAKKLYGKIERAQAIFETGLYIPRSALLHLGRTIRYRGITSRDYQLHLPYPRDEARGNFRKQKANSEAEYRTDSHIYHREKLEGIQTQLWQCVNTSSTGSPLPDDALCELYFPDHNLEKIFDQQAAYLERRVLQLAPERKTLQTAYKAARKHSDEIDDAGMFRDSGDADFKRPRRPAKYKSQPVVKPKSKICSTSQYACLPEDDE